MPRTGNFRHRKNQTGHVLRLRGPQAFARSAIAAHTDDSWRAGISAASATFAGADSGAFVSAARCPAGSTIRGTAGLAAWSAGTVSSGLDGKLAVAISGRKSNH